MKLPAQAVRKVGMTSSQHGPYVQGYTRATMGATEGCYLCRKVQGTLRKLHPIRMRKVRMTSSQYGPYALGYTRATMAGTEGCKPVRGSQSHKTGLSSD